MSKSFADARRWEQQGTKALLDAIAGLTEAQYDSPTLLPDWTRRHIVAHVAANAEALGNLVHWAATGEPTPMYASPEARAAGIKRGSRLTASEIDTWARESSAELETDMSALTDNQWQTEIRTAQGRTVPAIELPWMRSREVWVHAVDLDRGVRFSDLPDDFLTSLREDIVAKRGLTDLPGGPLAEVVAWLAGRPHALPVADLDPWL